MQSIDLGLAKAEARTLAKALRATCDPAWGAVLAEHVLGARLPPTGAVVGGFWPLAGEIDTRVLLHALAERGYEIALPETPAAGQMLRFRKWQPGDVLATGRFGTLHPAGAVLQPDFILVPLLAFDASGNRLGYGGGFYDRTLAALPEAFRLGCGFAAQEVERLPVEDTDLPLHAIATEREVRRFRRR